MVLTTFVLATCIQNRDIDKNLNEAVLKRNLALARRFVEQGGNPKADVGSLDTALHFAVRLAPTTERERVFSAQCTKMFIQELGAEIFDHPGYLNVAAQQCLHATVLVLVKHDAPQDSNTALLRVLKSHLLDNDYQKFAPHAEKTIAVLIESGIDVNHRSRNGEWPAPGEVPLSIPVFHGRLRQVLMLIEAGANVNQRRGNPNKNPYLYSYTPLHTVALESGPNQARIAEILLENGANPRLEDTLGRTPLDIARQKNNKSVIAVLERAR